MDNFTTNNYEMKREIINFSKKISDSSDKTESKFIMDMIYSISKSKDILLSSIAGALDEKTKKAYVIDSFYCFTLYHKIQHFTTTHNYEFGYFKTIYY